MGEKEEKELKEEAKQVFRRFYDKSRDVQRAASETIKELTEKTLKGVQPTTEKLKEITEGILEGLQEASQKMGGRFESLVKSLQELTQRASLSLREIMAGIREGYEETVARERSAECLRFITERRSITYFDPQKEIDDSLIKEILEVAATAPSGYNLQPWEAVVVKSKEKKKRLMEICYNQKKVVEASAVIVIIANTKAAEEHVDRVLESWTELGYISQKQKKKLREDILQDWKTPEKRKRKAVRDASLFAMNLMIAARMYGLETHPIEGFDEAKLKRFLGIGRERIIPLIVALGFRDTSKKLLPRAYRFGFEEFARIV
jgi:nitroreductase